MVRIFIPQEWADSAVMEDRVEIQGDTMNVQADRKNYILTEAVRIIGVEGGDPDTAQLVGKVKTHDQLSTLNAEQVGDSMICNDTAYRVQTGFLAEYQGHDDPVSVVFKT